uniref:Uncharacterized protein n=1 Tax=Anguilla anguilla TaxID=7936 RepID=A0A0E9R3J1_ANGAN
MEDSYPTYYPLHTKIIRTKQHVVCLIQYML